MKEQKPDKGWKNKVHEIIYEADTPLGKGFDILLFILIIISVLLVMLESVKWIDAEYHKILFILEWIVTVLFTIEYIARIVSIKQPKQYIFSFYGIIDLLSTIPLYLSYIFAGSQVLLAIRSLRLLRVFRILKLVRFLGEASQLKNALKASRAKITVFLFAVLILSVILGTVMYLIEGDEAGFTSIPTSIYWTIVTLTTVGYGDIAPITPQGQFIATLIMLVGYGVIAVPTGIVTVEFGKRSKSQQPSGENNFVHVNTQACRNCAKEGHRDDASHCYNCGSEL
ncbi:ion transporter [Zobellia galactanivorans]|uniref:Ion channel n=1 Tax=Zobellia galactanivorans (strain DSM 12802 / CCUG 47099 / CIP 106680 / NCIMB 13871 / Dsij) TaxID=63186 RepID=G0L4T4_ZOBGA|nr:MULTISPECIES: ion transporter [Zobellia]MBU3027072.1 ion transporter [Zobellia galactanivorans]MDO6517055.1 ion transporter [Zobellia uliginosa]MDO6807998.1 ion transporter [Zobellia galactanivorans]OWW24896.1 ion transporter [Zobellia sp. OII3]CAZ98890.1 Ion channel [Zobellia galactanivorans]